MSKLPITVTIITLNEEERLPKMLAPLVELVDEIVLVDSGSSDNTIEIAKSFGCKVYHRDWTGFGDQKVFAQRQASNDWILNLDADEILLPSVVRSIRAEFNKDSLLPAVYTLNIRHVSHLSHSLRPFPFAPTNCTPRLYHNSVASFNASSIHDKVIPNTNAKVFKLKGDVAHISLKSFEHMWEKILTYSQLQAENRIRYAHPKNPIILAIDPLFFFFKNYFVRRLCFVGIEGFVMACALSAGRALRIGLAHELWRKKKQSSPNTNEDL
jgi:glycosyltransferase involved in cell wall biosynthesis